LYSACNYDVKKNRKLKGAEADKESKTLEACKERCDAAGNTCLGIDFRKKARKGVNCWLHRNEGKTKRERGSKHYTKKEC
jgi:hypothetical protein